MHINRGEIKKMVKITDIPEAKTRMDLDDIPNEIELLLTEEKVLNALLDSETKKVVKTGGLSITYKTREEKVLTQKYSSAFGTILREHLTELGYDSTDELREAWHLYKKELPELNVKGKVYPRLFPVKRLDDFEVDLFVLKLPKSKSAKKV